MNRTEFMDLLRYYFRRVDEADLAEILSDYEAHFEEGRKAGLSEEDICRELGSPKAIYDMYAAEGMLHEKKDAPAPPPGASSRTAERLSLHADRLADQAEKLAGQAGQIAGKTIDRAQDAWDREIGPRVPGAAQAAGGLVWKVLFSACYAASFLVFLITALVVYLLSGTGAQFGGFSPLPGISAVTLWCIAGTGFFAGLALFFTGSEIRKLHRSRQAPPPPSSDGEAEAAGPEDGSSVDAPRGPIQPALLLPAAGRK